MQTSPFLPLVHDRTNRNLSTIAIWSFFLLKLETDVSKAQYVFIECVLCLCMTICLTIGHTLTSGFGRKWAMSFGLVSVTAETDCSLTVPLSVTAVSGKTTFGRSLVKVSQFSDFGPFSQYKNPKTNLPVTSLQPRGHIAEWFCFFPCRSRRSKGVPFRHRRFLAIPIHNATTRGAILRTNVLSHQNLCHFWGTFQCETYYTESLSQSHVTAATTLKLYCYIEGVWGEQGPLI